MFILNNWSLYQTNNVYFKQLIKILSNLFCWKLFISQ